MTAPPDATELRTVADNLRLTAHEAEVIRAAADRIEALESRLESAEAALRPALGYPHSLLCTCPACAHFAAYPAHRKESGDV